MILLKCSWKVVVKILFLRNLTCLPQFMLAYFLISKLLAIPFVLISVPKQFSCFSELMLQPVGKEGSVSSILVWSQGMWSLMWLCVHEAEISSTEGYCSNLKGASQHSSTEENQKNCREVCLTPSNHTFELYICHCVSKCLHWCPCLSHPREGHSGLPGQCRALLSLGWRMLVPAPHLLWAGNELQLKNSLLTWDIAAFLARKQIAAGSTELCEAVRSTCTGSDINNTDEKGVAKWGSRL